MLILKLAAVLGAVAVLSSLAIAQQAEPNTKKADKKTTPESLVGRYTITSGEKEGSKEPEERIKGTTVTFTKETVIVADKDKKGDLFRELQARHQDDALSDHDDQQGRRLGG